MTEEEKKETIFVQCRGGVSLPFLGKKEHEHHQSPTQAISNNRK